MGQCQCQEQPQLIKNKVENSRKYPQLKPVSTTETFQPFNIYESKIANPPALQQKLESLDIHEAVHPSLDNMVLTVDPKEIQVFEKVQEYKPPPKPQLPKIIEVEKVQQFAPPPLPAKLKQTLDKLNVFKFQRGGAKQLNHRLGLYYGQNRNNLPHGKGQLFTKKGLYQGWFSDGQCNGQGRFIFENGSYYEGNFANNLADGEGTYTYPENVIQKGIWKQNLLNGPGQQIALNKHKYKGNFVKSIKNGEGRLQLQNGWVYQGNFVNDKMQGQGKMIFGNDSYYEGQWLNNRFHGKGKFVFQNQEYYEGGYKLNIRQGEGVYKQFKKMYEGTWKDGAKNGTGKLKDEKKDKDILGRWQKGVLKAIAQG